mmetsp:Transcript_25985/g.58723  ORF Transcript_25985/g.58723 Transcript_25985/m.58723 type:complete len:354 (+) Transcript_25985:131-1192(+)
MASAVPRVLTLSWRRRPFLSRGTTRREARSGGRIFSARSMETPRMYRSLLIRSCSRLTFLVFFASPREQATSSPHTDTSSSEKQRMTRSLATSTRRKGFSARSNLTFPANCSLLEKKSSRRVQPGLSSTRLSSSPFLLQYSLSAWRSEKMIVCLISSITSSAAFSRGSTSTLPMPVSNLATLSTQTLKSTSCGDRREEAVVVKTRKMSSKTMLFASHAKMYRAIREVDMTGKRGREWRRVEVWLRCLSPEATASATSVGRGCRRQRWKKDRIRCSESLVTMASTREGTASFLRIPICLAVVRYSGLGLSVLFSLRMVKLSDADKDMSTRIASRIARRKVPGFSLAGLRTDPAR